MNTATTSIDCTNGKPKARLQVDHIDGPVLFCWNGTMHWLNLWEQMLLALGLVTAEQLEAKYSPPFPYATAKQTELAKPKRGHYGCLPSGDTCILPPSEKGPQGDSIPNSEAPCGDSVPSSELYKE